MVESWIFLIQDWRCSASIATQNSIADHVNKLCSIRIKLRNSDNWLSILLLQFSKMSFLTSITSILHLSIRINQQTSIMITVKKLWKLTYSWPSNFMDNSSSRTLCMEHCIWWMMYEDWVLWSHLVHFVMKFARIAKTNSGTSLMSTEIVQTNRRD